MDIHFASTGTTVQIKDEYIPSYLPDDAYNYILGLQEMEYRKSPTCQKKQEEINKEKGKVERRVKARDEIAKKEAALIKKYQSVISHYDELFARMMHITKKGCVNPIIPFIHAEFNYDCYNCLCAIQGRNNDTDLYGVLYNVEEFRDKDGEVYNFINEIYRGLTINKDAHEITFKLKEVMFPDRNFERHEAESFTSDECDITISTVDEIKFERDLREGYTFGDFPCPQLTEYEQNNSLFYRPPLPCFVIQTSVDFYWDDIESGKRFKIDPIALKYFMKTKKRYYAFLGVKLSDEDVRNIKIDLNMKRDMGDIINLYEMNFSEMCDSLISRNRSIENFYCNQLKNLKDLEFDNTIEKTLHEEDIWDEWISKKYRSGFIQRHIGIKFITTCSEINLNGFIDEEIKNVKETYYKFQQRLGMIGEDLAMIPSCVISEQENRKNQIKLIRRGRTYARQFKLKSRKEKEVQS